MSKLTQSKEQIQADLNLLDSNTATEGQVLTANGTGGATWQDPSGGGTEVVANPTGEATEELTKLQVGSSVYSIPTGGSGGGTYLYKHELTIDGDSFVMISPDVNNTTAAGQIIQQNPLTFYFVEDNKMYSCIFENSNDRLNAYTKFYYYNEGVISNKTYTLMSTVSDTVTPL